jgi:hypothetical protein
MTPKPLKRGDGKPYIRRANGKEKALTFRDAVRLAFYRDRYGTRGFYIMTQRRSGPGIMACGRTRAEIVGTIANCWFVHFNSWANRIKRFAQGKSNPRTQPQDRRRPCKNR